MGRLKAAVLHLLGGSDGRISWGKIVTVAIMALAACGRPLSDAIGVAILGYSFGRSYLASKDGPDA